MPPEVLEYIRSQRTGVLAVEMPNGAPHAATVHFAHTENPVIFYFETYREYRKTEPILKNAVTRSSFVLGTDEATMKTLQIDGEVRLITDQEIIENTYFTKFPNKKAKHEADPEKFVFFSLTPTWWRFTDWEHPNGKQILSSDTR